MGPRSACTVATHAMRVAADMAPNVPCPELSFFAFLRVFAVNQLLFRFSALLQLGREGVEGAVVGVDAGDVVALAGGVGADAGLAPDHALAAGGEAGGGAGALAADADVTTRGFDASQQGLEAGVLGIAGHTGLPGGRNELQLALGGQGLDVGAHLGDIVLGDGPDLHADGAAVMLKMPGVPTWT